MFINYIIIIFIALTYSVLTMAMTGVDDWHFIDIVLFGGDGR